MSTPPSPRSISHYDIESLLGRGGMGSVYLARDRRDGTAVAIKLLHAHLETDDTFRQRFEREAHFAALLRSPYTVHLLDYGIEEGTYFIAMEYVDGRSLRDMIRDDGPVEAREALRIAAAVAHALEEAEARGVVHRDIKPDNILLGRDGSVKVSDFGIARQLGSGAVTMPGAFVGTMVYAAPEIARGEVDHRSDIYSLGATLYDALTGRPPFEGQPLEMLRQHADAPVPEEPLAGVPQEAKDVVLRCMAKDPNDRYQSASELASALEQAADAAPSTPPPPPPSDIEATQIATPPPATPPPEPVGATEVMRPPSEALRPQSTAGPEIEGRLGPARGGFFASRFGSVRYDLTLTNRGDVPATVTLTAQESSGRAAISLPATATIAPRTSATIPVAIKPRNRRRSGGAESIPFTITAAGTGGQPPTVVSGSFNDQAFPMGVVMGVLVAGVAAVIAVIALIVLGGGGGEDGSGDGLTYDDLGRMMLTEEDLSPAFSEFSEDARLSGPLSNEDVIADACDSAAVTSAVASEGRIKGYASVYRPARVTARAIEIRSRVDEYETEAGASDALASYAEMQRTGAGELECAGVTVTDATEFDVVDIGEEARGFEGTHVAGSEEPQANRVATVQGADVAVTAIGFTLGGFVGRVEIDGDPAGDYQQLAIDLARKLEARMSAVIEGAEETPTPSPTGEASGSATPEGSETPAASGTTTPTATPTPPGATPTATKTQGATAAPTQQPTQKPTTAPTAKPTAQPTQAPQAPTISSVGCPTTADVGEQITCQPSISGTVTSRSWSAPGGSPASGSGATFSTTYSSPGAKTVTLTACNGTACSNKQATVEVFEVIIEGYTIFVDTYLDAGRNSFVTVSLYADVPSSGLAYWDIDVEFDTSLLTYDSCFASYGECGLLFFDDAVTFTADVGDVGSGFIELGSMTFVTGSMPGFADLTPVIYGLEDGSLNEVSDEALVVIGGISIQ